MLTRHCELLLKAEKDPAHNFLCRVSPGEGPEKDMWRILIFILATGVPASAQGLSIGSGQPREYPYPAEPQYQYPIQDSRPRAHLKCPKGQAPFQGKCRVARPVH